MSHATASPTLPPPPLPAPGERWALFLDIDGTLVGFESDPADVRLPRELRDLLERVRQALDGAVAILSGRSLVDVDRLSAPMTFVAGALHGAEHRDPSGGIVRTYASEATSLRVARACAAGVRDWRGVVVEAKSGAAFAIHYRNAPAAGADVRALAQSIAESTDGEFVVQLGERVAELKPAGPDKGASVDALASVPPFAGRRPVVLGDDLTDESAFARAAAHGGFGVVVGARRPTAATFALADPAATRGWLLALAGHLHARKDK